MFFKAEYLIMICNSNLNYMEKQKLKVDVNTVFKEILKKKNSSLHSYPLTNNYVNCFSHPSGLLVQNNSYHCS